MTTDTSHIRYRIKVIDDSCAHLLYAGSGVAGCLDPAPLLGYQCHGCGRPLGKSVTLLNGRPNCGCGRSGDHVLGIDRTAR